MLEAHFIPATGTHELDHDGTPKKTEVPKGKEGKEGTYHYNSGTLAVIDREGNYWVGRPTKEAYAALAQNGFREDAIYVPHCSDHGIWLKKHLDSRQNNQRKDSLVDKLVGAGIPEEAIYGNEGLWSYIREIERNDFVSANQTFFVTDNCGENWLLKSTKNKTKARIEAAANYHLSEHFDFIVPGNAPRPIEANGQYFTLQKFISDEVTVIRPLEYWLGSLAMFHRDAERILNDNGVEVQEIEFRSAEGEEERYSQGRRNNLLRFDRARLEDCIDYLRETDYKTFIHRDVKRTHLLGRHLIDLEQSGIGNPGIDLAMLFMEYRVPKEQWDKHLKTYLAIKGSPDEFGQLQEGVEVAAYYMANKEVISSSLKPLSPTRIEQNHHLSAQAN